MNVSSSAFLGPLLGTAFGLGILFQSTIGALALYTKDYGYGSKLRQDRRRLVLVLGIILAALWSQLDFGGFMIPRTLPLVCTGVVIANTVADQAARVVIGGYLLWSVAHVNKSYTERYLVGALIGVRAIAGAVQAAFIRQQFVQVCLPLTTLLPAAIAVIGLDTVVLMITVVRIFTLGLFNEARDKSLGLKQAHSKGLLFITLGFFVWSAASALMMLGRPGTSVIFMSALPGTGLTILIGFMATHFLSLTIARGKDASTPSALSPGHMASTGDDDLNATTKTDDANRKALFVVNPSNTSRDSRDSPTVMYQRNSVKTSDRADYGYSTTTVREIGGYKGPIVMENDLMQESNGAAQFASGAEAALVITTRLNAVDRRVRGQAGKDSKSRPFGKPTSPVKQNIRSLGISAPLAADGNDPALKIPTMELGQAMAKEKERREELRIRGKRPPPPPPIYTPSAALVTGGDATITGPLDTIPLPYRDLSTKSSTTTGRSASPGQDELKRRSPKNDYEAGVAETGLERKNTLPRTPKAGPPTSSRFNRRQSPPGTGDRDMQRVMLINNIVYDDPAAVAAISQSAKVYTESRQQDPFRTPHVRPLQRFNTTKSTGSMIHRPRPYSRRQAGERNVFPNEKSPGRPRSRSASSLWSRQPGWSSTGEVENVPPIPLPTTAKALARLLPNDTKSMTMDEKMQYLFPAPPGVPQIRTIQEGKRRSSVPEVPVIDPKFDIASVATNATAGEPRVSSQISTMEEATAKIVAHGQSKKQSDAWWKDSEVSGSVAHTIPGKDTQQRVHVANSAAEKPTSMHEGASVSVIPTIQTIKSVFEDQAFSPTNMMSALRHQSIAKEAVAEPPGIKLSWKDPFKLQRGPPQQTETTYEDEMKDISDMLECSSLLDTEEASHFPPRLEDDRNPFFLESGDNTTEHITPRPRSGHKSWHKRIGDDLPTFSGRRAHSRGNSRVMPPPTPLLLTSAGRPLIALTQDSMTMVIDTPSRALQEIQAQLERFEKPEHESLGVISFQDREDRIDSRAGLLENLENELGAQENFLANLQRTFARESNFTLSPPMDLVSPSMMEDAAVDMNVYMAPSPFIPGNFEEDFAPSPPREPDQNTLTRAAIWQQKLAQAQAEFDAKSPEILRRKPSVNFLQIGKKPLPSPTPPESINSPSESGYSGTDEDEEDEENNVFYLEPVSYVRSYSPTIQPKPGFLWQVQKTTQPSAGDKLWVSRAVLSQRPFFLEAAARDTRPVQRRISKPLLLESGRLWSKTAIKSTQLSHGLWVSHKSMPQSIGSRCIIRRPQRKSRRGTVLANIVESPVALSHNDSGSLGIFQCPSAEVSSQPSFEPTKGGGPYYTEHGYGGFTASSSLEARTRELEELELNFEYSEDYGHEYSSDDSDVNFEIEERDFESHETTLGNIAKLLGSETKELPSRESLFQLGRATLMEDYAQEVDTMQYPQIYASIVNEPFTPVNSNVVPSGSPLRRTGQPNEVLLSEERGSSSLVTYPIYLEDGNVIRNMGMDITEVSSPHEEKLWAMSDTPTLEKLTGLPQPSREIWQSYMPAPATHKWLTSPVSDAPTINTTELWSSKLGSPAQAPKAMWYKASGATVDSALSASSISSLAISKASEAKIYALYYQHTMRGRLWTKPEILAMNNPVGLPQPSTVIWQTYFCSVGDDRKNRGFAGDRLRIQSKELWKSEGVFHPSLNLPPSTGMWSPNWRRAAAMFVPRSGELGNAVDEIPMAMIKLSISSTVPFPKFRDVRNSTIDVNLQGLWVPTGPRSIVASQGLFSPSATPRISDRTTSGTPAALIMVRKPRVAIIAPLFSVSQSLWSTSSILATPFSRDWISESSVRPPSPTGSPTSSGATTPDMDEVFDRNSFSSILTKASSVWPSRLETVKSSLFLEGISDRQSPVSPLRPKDVDFAAKHERTNTPNSNDPVVPHRVPSKKGIRNMFESMSKAPDLPPVPKSMPNKRGIRNMFESMNKVPSTPPVSREISAPKSPQVKTISRVQALIQKRQSNTKAHWDAALTEAIEAGQPKDQIITSLPTLGTDIVATGPKKFMRLTASPPGNRNVTVVPAVPTVPAVPALRPVRITALQSKSTAQVEPVKASTLRKARNATTNSQWESALNEAIALGKVIGATNLVAMKSSGTAVVIDNLKIQASAKSSSVHSKERLQNITDESWDFALVQATSRIHRQSVTLEDRNSALGVALSYSRFMVDYDSGVSHTATDGQSIRPSALSVHPAAFGHVSADFDPAVRHPVFFGDSMITLASSVHPAALGHVRVSNVAVPAPLIASMWSSPTKIARDVESCESLWTGFRESNDIKVASLDVHNDSPRKPRVASHAKLSILESTELFSTSTPDIATGRPNWLRSTSEPSLVLEGSIKKFLTIQMESSKQLPSWDAPSNASILGEAPFLLEQTVSSTSETPAFASSLPSLIQPAIYSRSTTMSSLASPNAFSNSAARSSLIPGLPQAVDPKKSRVTLPPMPPMPPIPSVPPVPVAPPKPGTKKKASVWSRLVAAGTSEISAKFAEETKPVARPSKKPKVDKELSGISVEEKTLQAGLQTSVVPVETTALPKNVVLMVNGTWSMPPTAPAPVVSATGMWIAQPGKPSMVRKPMSIRSNSADVVVNKTSSTKKYNDAPVAKLSSSILWRQTQEGKYHALRTWLDDTSKAHSSPSVKSIVPKTCSWTWVAPDPAPKYVASATGMWTSQTSSYTTKPVMRDLFIFSDLDSEALHMQSKRFSGLPLTGLSSFSLWHENDYEVPSEAQDWLQKTSNTKSVSMVSDSAAKTLPRSDSASQLWVDTATIQEKPLTVETAMWTPRKPVVGLPKPSSHNSIRMVDTAASTPRVPSQRIVNLSLAQLSSSSLWQAANRRTAKFERDWLPSTAVSNTKTSTQEAQLATSVVVKSLLWVAPSPSSQIILSNTGLWAAQTQAPVTGPESRFTLDVDTSPKVLRNATKSRSESPLSILKSSTLWQAEKKIVRTDKCWIHGGEALQPLSLWTQPEQLVIPTGPRGALWTSLSPSSRFHESGKEIPVSLSEDKSRPPRTEKLPLATLESNTTWQAVVTSSNDKDLQGRDWLVFSSAQRHTGVDAYGAIEDDASESVLSLDSDDSSSFSDGSSVVEDKLDILPFVGQGVDDKEQEGEVEILSLGGSVGLS